MLDSMAWDMEREESSKLGFGAASGGLLKGEAEYEESAAQEQEQAGQDDSRMRVLSGYASIEAVDTEAARSAIAERAVAEGGYVESSSSSRVSVRVPSERFEAVFSWILGLGRLVRQEVSSFDVTDYYQDLEAKLKLAEDTRERLYAILDKTEDVEERVAILMEIRRLSEQIESMRATLSFIGESVRFSRIDVDIAPILKGGASSTRTIPFPWIASLKPGQRLSRVAPKALAIEAGPGFAVFSKKGEAYYAESPKGVRLAIGSVANEPRADEDFWAKALAYNLGPLYAKTEAIEHGPRLKGARFVSMDVEPFVYEVLVSVQGERIDVVEAYYPNLAEFAALGPAIEAALKEASK
jgi:hypothetical protein